jgi:hypothetical protein
MQNNNENTLLEVRKAYRLLFDYQARVLDLISFISGSFGFDYNGGYPKFSNSGPNNGRGNLGLWAWDWLNMYYYEFNFQPKVVDKDKLYFSIFILNDTGFFQANKKSKIAKTAVDAFDSPENSGTKLIFAVGKNTWNGWGANWDNEEFILQNEGHKGLDDKKMVFKSYPLSKFFNEDDTIIMLKDFENYCDKFNITFKYQEKKIK